MSGRRIADVQRSVDEVGMVRRPGLTEEVEHESEEDGPDDLG